jgi:hypothetical protein
MSHLVNATTFALSKIYFVVELFCRLSAHLRLQWCVGLADVLCKHRLPYLVVICSVLVLDFVKTTLLFSLHLGARFGHADIALFLAR